MIIYYYKIYLTKEKEGGLSKVLDCYLCKYIIDTVVESYGEDSQGNYFCQHCLDNVPGLIDVIVNINNPNTRRLDKHG